MGGWGRYRKGRYHVLLLWTFASEVVSSKIPTSHRVIWSSYMSTTLLLHCQEKYFHQGCSCVSLTFSRNIAPSYAFLLVVVDVDQ
jgi:hypothetical protein